MKTSLKKNHLPFLSMLPFCLMAASGFCFSPTCAAAGVELGSSGIDSNSDISRNVLDISGNALAVVSGGGYLEKVNIISTMTPEL